MSKRNGLSKTLLYIGMALLAVATIAVVVGLVNRPSPAASPEERSGTPADSPSPTLSGKTPPVVAFIGDSYAEGQGASAEENRWTTLLSEQLGWVEMNFARGGSGYVSAVTDNAELACGLDYCPSYSEMVDKVAEAEPDIVFVSGGRNDTGTAGFVLEAKINDLYMNLRKELPEAKIVATNPVWAANDKPFGAPMFGATVKSAVKAAGGTYVDIGQPLEGRPELIAEDGLHPNDAGHEVLAEETVDALVAKGFG
ncbi:SGNH/GDSL hydrolase family protein [Arthrobacter monumenti]